MTLGHLQLEPYPTQTHHTPRRPSQRPPPQLAAARAARHSTSPRAAYDCATLENRPQRAAATAASAMQRRSCKWCQIIVRARACAWELCVRMCARTRACAWGGACVHACAREIACVGGSFGHCFCVLVCTQSRGSALGLWVGGGATLLSLRSEKGGAEGVINGAVLTLTRTVEVVTRPGWSPHEPPLPPAKRLGYGSWSVRPMARPTAHPMVRRGQATAHPLALPSARGRCRRRRCSRRLRLPCSPCLPNHPDTRWRN